MDHKSRGGNELIQSFKDKLEHDIDTSSQNFIEENEKKRKFTEVSLVVIGQSISSCVNWKP